MLSSIGIESIHHSTFFGVRSRPSSAHSLRKAWLACRHWRGQMRHPNWIEPGNSILRLERWEELGSVRSQGHGFAENTAKSLLHDCQSPKMAELYADAVEMRCELRRRRLKFTQRLPHVIWVVQPPASWRLECIPYRTFLLQSNPQKLLHHQSASQLGCISQPLLWKFLN